MYNDIKSGVVKAEVILIYKMSRFFRNVHLWHVDETLFTDLGVRFISVTEPIPEDGPLADLQKTIIRAFDQFTSANIGLFSLDGSKQVVLSAPV